MFLWPPISVYSTIHLEEKLYNSHESALIILTEIVCVGFVCSFSRIAKKPNFRVVLIHNVEFIALNIVKCVYGIRMTWIASRVSTRSCIRLTKIHGATWKLWNYTCLQILLRICSHFVSILPLRAPNGPIWRRQYYARRICCSHLHVNWIIVKLTTRSHFK